LALGGSGGPGGIGIQHEVRLPANAETGTEATGSALQATDLVHSTALTVLPAAAPAPVVEVAPTPSVVVLIVVTPAPFRIDAGALATGATPVVTPERLPVVAGLIEAEPVPTPSEPTVVPPAPPAPELPPAMPQVQADLRETPFDVDFDSLPLFAGDVPTAAPVVEEGDDTFAVEAGLVAAALVIGGAGNFQPEPRRRFELAEVN
jgi:hypothetical protein